MYLNYTIQSSLIIMHFEPEFFYAGMYGNGCFCNVYIIMIISWLDKSLWFSSIELNCMCMCACVYIQVWEFRVKGQNVYIMVELQSPVVKWILFANGELLPCTYLSSLSQLYHMQLSTVNSWTTHVGHVQSVYITWTLRNSHLEVWNSYVAMTMHLLHVMCAWFVRMRDRTSYPAVARNNI